MFLLVGCSFTFQYLLCFVHGQSQRTKEIGKKRKKLAIFVTSLASSTLVLVSTFELLEVYLVAFHLHFTDERNDDIRHLHQSFPR